MCGRISYIWVGEFSGSILGGRFFTRWWANFSHTGGRIIRVDFGWANFSHLKNSGRIFTRRWANLSHVGGRIFRVNFRWAIFPHLKNSGRIFHVDGRISDTWVGEFAGSIFDGRFFHISKIVGDFFTRGWANFSHLAGRIFRVNFRWAIFIHLKNSGRFFHTRVGEFLTHEWANFQGQFWVGECCTSQKQWAIFTHFVKEDPHLRQILDKEALASLLI